MARVKSRTRDLADIMLGFRSDFAQVTRTNAAAIPYLLEANRRLAQAEIGPVGQTMAGSDRVAGHDLVDNT